MKRVFLVLVIALIVATMIVVSALPALAQSSTPICAWYYTNGDGAYLRSEGVNLYYDYWYGWHLWCQSPVYGWYVLQ